MTTYRKVTGVEASDRARDRVRELEKRKKELEDELGAFDDADEKRDRVAELEREVAELEVAVEAERRQRDAATDKRSNVMDSIKQLETIEKAVANATAEPARLRKAAEDLYDEVVKRIAETEGCDMRRAHYLAGKDPIGKRAYAQVVELQERARTARDGAGRIGAFLG